MIRMEGPTETTANGEYDSGKQNRYGNVHVFGLDSWWKKLLLILVVVAVIVVIFAVISGIVSPIAPVLIPLLVIILLVRMLRRRW